MRTFLIFLVLPLLFASCNSDNDKETIEYNETQGYLTNLASVQYGILGLWINDTSISNSYVRYDSNEKGCSGTDKNNLTNCGKYLIISKNGTFYMRRYYSEDLEGTGSYDDIEITILDNQSLTLKLNNSISTLKRETE